MHIFQLFSIILSPLLCLASSENPMVPKLVSNSLSIFDHAWNYKLFSLENQEITVSNVFIALISLIIGLKLASHLSKTFKRKLFSWIQLDKNSQALIGRVVDYIFTVTIVIIVLDIARVPITIFTFIGGAFVISIGLSAQHLINNFISGIALILESKIKVGDLIEFEDVIGRVENIEARMIRIKLQSNLEVFIPHSKLMQEKFTHWSCNNSRVRISTEIKIDQKDNINNDLQDIILNAVTQNRNIITTPKPQVLLLAFENNILHYEINFWINLNNSDRKIIISEVNVQILNALKVHNISLAIPSRRYINN
jgi:potassium efflux system protein